MLASSAVNTYTCLHFHTMLISCLLYLLCSRECVLSSIEDETLAPYVKLLMFALWYNTHAHCVTGRVRLLVLVLSKPCVSCLAFIWFDTMSSKVEIRKFLTEYYFLRVHVFYHILLACHFIVCLGSSLTKDGS